MKAYIRRMLSPNVVTLLLIAMFIRLFGIYSAYISDEPLFLRNVKLLRDGIFDLTLYNFHPPLGILAFFITTSVFGMNILGMRIMPLIFGLVTIYFTYLLSKKIYGERIAILSVILMTFSFYAVWASLFIDAENSLLVSLVAATFYSYLKFREANVSDNKKQLFFTGIFFGLALLTKYPAILIIATLILFELSNSRISIKSDIKTILQSIYPILYVLIIGGGIFSIFPIMSFLTGNFDMFTRTLVWGHLAIEESFSMRDIFISIIKTVYFSIQYTTPLIPALILFSFRQRTSKDKLLFLWLLVFLIFYTFILPGKTKIKYLTIIIPPIYILAARGFASVSDNLKKFPFFSISVYTLTCASIIFLLNQYGSIEAFNMQKISFATILANGLIWYGGTISTPFTIHIHSFIFVVVLGAVLSAIMLFKKEFFEKSFIILLALSIAFNGYILFQSFYPIVGPNYTQTLKEIAFDLENSEELLYATYPFREALNAYFSKERVDSFEYGKRGTLILINTQVFEVPQFRETYAYVKNNCSLERIYYSNNYPLGYIYDC